MPPQVGPRSVEEKYALYVLDRGMPADDFWHLPLATVEQIFASYDAFTTWRNRPLREGDPVPMKKEKMKERARQRFGKAGAPDGGQQ